MTDTQTDIKITPEELEELEYIRQEREGGRLL